MDQQLRNDVGDHTAGVTPVPIPNTEVKPRRADCTARETVWESRSSPALIKAQLRDQLSLFRLGQTSLKTKRVQPRERKALARRPRSNFSKPATHPRPIREAELPIPFVTDLADDVAGWTTCPGVFFTVRSGKRQSVS